MALGRTSFTTGKSRRPRILEARPLVPDDLRVLTAPRPPAATIQVLRERHHRIASLVAQGIPDYRVCAMTGIAGTTLARYKHDPAFRELVTQYGKSIDESTLDEALHYRREGFANMVTMERMVTDQLAKADETGEALPLNTLFKGIADRADRFGFGKHTTQTNVHVGMGNAIDAMRERLSRVTVIDATACPVAPSLPGPGASAPHRPAQAAPFKRRGL